MLGSLNWLPSPDWLDVSFELLIDLEKETIDMLKNSHRTAAAATLGTEEKDQSAGHDRQKPKRERRKLDIKMNVIPPTRLAPFDSAAR